MTGAALDRERLAKLLGMLGSNHEGEVAAAGRAADALVRRAGMRWHDVVSPALPSPVPLDYSGATNRVAEALDLCMAFDDALTAWERGFIASLRHQRFRVTFRQAKILDQIVAKVRAKAAA